MAYNPSEGAGDTTPPASMMRSQKRKQTRKQSRKGKRGY